MLLHDVSAKIVSYGRKYKPCLPNSKFISYHFLKMSEPYEICEINWITVHVYLVMYINIGKFGECQNVLHENYVYLCCFILMMHSEKFDIDMCRVDAYLD